MKSLWNIHENFGKLLVSLLIAYYFAVEPEEAASANIKNCNK